MTRDEAKKFLEGLKEHHIEIIGNEILPTEEYLKICDVINLLSAEPCEDAVSRADTLAEFKRLYFDNDTVIRCAEIVLGGMSPVQPKEKAGH